MFNNENIAKEKKPNVKKIKEYDLNQLITTCIHYKDNILLSYDNNLIQVIEFSQIVNNSFTPSPGVFNEKLKEVITKLYRNDIIYQIYNIKKENKETPHNKFIYKNFFSSILNSSYYDGMNYKHYNSKIYIAIVKTNNIVSNNSFFNFHKSKFQHNIIKYLELNSAILSDITKAITTHLQDYKPKILSIISSLDKIPNEINKTESSNNIDAKILNNINATKNNIAKNDINIYNQENDLNYNENTNLKSELIDFYYQIINFNSNKCFNNIFSDLFYDINEDNIITISTNESINKSIHNTSKKQYFKIISLKDVNLSNTEEIIKIISLNVNMCISEALIPVNTFSSSKTQQVNDWSFIVTQKKAHKLQIQKKIQALSVANDENLMTINNFHAYKNLNQTSSSLLVSDKAAFYISRFIVLFNDDIKKLQEEAKLVYGALQDSGLPAVAEDIMLEHCLSSYFAGNFYKIKRLSLVFEDQICIFSMFDHDKNGDFFIKNQYYTCVFKSIYDSNFYYNLFAKMQTNQYTSNNNTLIISKFTDNAFLNFLTSMIMQKNTSNFYISSKSQNIIFSKIMGFKIIKSFNFFKLLSKETFKYFFHFFRIIFISFYCKENYCEENNQTYLKTNKSNIPLEQITNQSTTTITTNLELNNQIQEEIVIFLKLLLLDKNKDISNILLKYKEIKTASVDVKTKIIFILEQISNYYSEFCGIDDNIKRDNISSINDEINSSNDKQLNEISVLNIIDNLSIDEYIIKNDQYDIENLLINKANNYLKTQKISNQINIFDDLVLNLSNINDENFYAKHYPFNDERKIDIFLQKQKFNQIFRSSYIFLSLIVILPRINQNNNSNKLKIVYIDDLNLLSYLNFLNIDLIDEDFFSKNNTNINTEKSNTSNNNSKTYLSLLINLLKNNNQIFISSISSSNKKNIDINLFDNIFNFDIKHKANNKKYNQLANLEYKNKEYHTYLKFNIDKLFGFHDILNLSNSDQKELLSAIEQKNYNEFLINFITKKQNKMQFFL